MIGRLLELALGLSGFATVLIATLPAPLRAKLLAALKVKDSRNS